MGIIHHLAFPRLLICVFASALVELRGNGDIKIILGDRSVPQMIPRLQPELMSAIEPGSVLLEDPMMCLQLCADQHYLPSWVVKVC